MWACLVGQSVIANKKLLHVFQKAYHELYNLAGFFCATIRCQRAKKLVDACKRSSGFPIAEFEMIGFAFHSHNHCCSPTFGFSTRSKQRMYAPLGAGSSLLPSVARVSL